MVVFCDIPDLASKLSFCCLFSICPNCWATHLLNLVWCRLLVLRIYHSLNYCCIWALCHCFGVIFCEYILVYYFGVYSGWYDCANLCEVISFYSWCWSLCKISHVLFGCWVGCQPLLVYSIMWYHSKEKTLLCHKYFRHLHQTNTAVFTIPSTIMQAKFHICSTIIRRNRLLCECCSSVDQHC